MLHKNTQPRHGQLNDRVHTHLDSYDGITRRQADDRTMHAHVHEFTTMTSKNTIEADKIALVRVRWSMFSDMNPAIMGTWRVSAILESLQPGNKKQIALTPDTTLALTPQHGSVDYTAWVKIPANTVTFDEDEGSKSYRLVVTVTYNAPRIPAVPLTSGVEALAFQSHFVLAAPLIYQKPTGLPGSETDCVDGPELQFYIVIDGVYSDLSKGIIRSKTVGSGRGACRSEGSLLDVIRGYSRVTCKNRD